MTKTTPCKIKYAFERYLSSYDSCLDDVYNTYSYAKERAYDYCMELYRKYDGERPRIIGANTTTFSFGFIGVINGRYAFFYITRDYDRFCYLNDESELVNN